MADFSPPLEEFGFSLHKGAFRDALALTYGWMPSNTPINCPCGTHFSVEHALSCPKGRFPSIRHNEVRDTVADWMSEVCTLQPITGETLTGTSAISGDGARLDVAANGFWGGRFERAYFDVRIFNAHPPSNRQQCLASTYRKHERIKIRAYEQRVREVEHGSFTPLIMSLTGGCGNAANICYKRLASMLTEKRDQPYSITLAWMRCKLSFTLLRSAIQCIRGTRSARGHALRQAVPPSDLVAAVKYVILNLAHMNCAHFFYHNLSLFSLAPPLSPIALCTNVILYYLHPKKYIYIYYHAYCHPEKKVCMSVIA